MKSIYTIITLFITMTAFAQVGQNPQPSNIVNICSGVTEEDVPKYSYFKDVFNTFDNFIGTWQWSNGNEIVVFELTKVTQKFNTEDDMFYDYIIGNYSYSVDGGNSYIVNTITTPIDENYEENPMYTACPENNKLRFIFEDVVLNKSYCYATFEFSLGNLTQLEVKIENPLEVGGRFEGEPEYNFDFTLPTNIIVTKQ